MGKRKAKANPGAFPEYDALDIDQLYNERRSLGLQMQSVGKQYQDARVRNDYITSRIRLMRNGETGIGISDHAVIRYLERVKGFDVSAIRSEIRAIAALKKVDQVADQVITDAGLSFAIYDGQRIATIWPDDGNVPSYARKKEPQP